jgi:DNA polymerase II small subunit/DNA polymerase delta subunit B
LVIAGNLIGTPSEEDIRKRTTKNQFGTTVVTYDPIPTQLVDEFLGSLVSGLEVDLMPGNQDPCSQILPQQRIQPSMFAKSCRYNSLQTVSNPYTFTVGDTL